ncbi:MAG: molybdopterin molybdotransferase MoeA [Dehalococcoidales bacterium]|nr:molybdopterin molybdotransferase MoeA [Dehalococcoidales bacterium]
MDEIEIDEGTGYTGFDEALNLVRESIRPVGVIEKSLIECAGYISAGDVFARVNSPSRDASLKDGFAVRSADISSAADDDPVRLNVIGAVYAGGFFAGQMDTGECIKVCTGAPVPDGADAVIAAELCEEDDESICVLTGITPGQNIAPVGDDVKRGDKIISEGSIITPSVTAYLAVGGIDRLKVYRKPTFAILSIGDELVEPGNPLEDGQIFASNLMYNSAWMSLLGIPYAYALVKDDETQIREALEKLVPQADAVITSGGVMHSERDLIVGVMNELGWDMKFRHVRMGPGKATAFGLLGRKPVFCFSGGPNSNALGFLQFALAGIYEMQGGKGTPLEMVEAQLTRDIRGRNENWTEFRDGRLTRDKKGNLLVSPVTGGSKVKSMAEAESLIIKPEGVKLLKQGRMVKVQLLPKTTVWQE